ncbi:glycosyltransferase family 2 protein [Methylobacterium radiodurans]|uniref:Glycosyltransferase family 2 protein n=2 Tax=Methylobacterium radiodurans TaxID=2202828 RepID=A0A2U8VPT0_9HYPH|nr:glycosyltransferase family 2 protein [Methylobacterium radiodurans]
MRDVAVAIVGYRCAEAIRACLAQLDRSTVPVGAVCICENGGPEAFAELAAALRTELACTEAGADPGAPPPAAESLVLRPGRPGGAIGAVRLYRAQGNLGYAGAVNLVIAALAERPDWTALWVLNPDTLPTPTALAAVQARAEAGGYGIVGSRLVIQRSGRVQLYGGRWRRWLGRGYNIGLGAAAEAPIDPAAVESAQHYVSGAAMFVSRAYIEAVGPMREDYFLYAEEVDWCLRRGTFRLGYAHDSVVLHDHGAVIGSSVDRRARTPLSVFLDERNRLVLTRRFYPLAFPVAAVMALLFTTQYLRAGAVRNFRVALAGWWAGLRGETGFPHHLGPVPRPR